MVRLISVAAILSILCMGAAGCGGGNLGEVTGKVTMDGEPLPNAIVTFMPIEGGRASIGKTDENGNYTLMYLDEEGALIGKHKISVTTAPQASSEPQKQIRSDDPEYAKQAASRQSDYDTAKVTEPIPARYNSETTLVKEVEPGENVINLPLESK